LIDGICAILTGLHMMSFIRVIWLHCCCLSCANLVQWHSLTIILSFYFFSILA